MEKKSYNPGIVGLDGKSWSQMKAVQNIEKSFSSTSFSQTNKLQPSTNQNPQPIKPEKK